MSYTGYTKSKVVGYGLTKGQIEVIKMQVYRFNATYESLAKHYKVSLNAIRQVVDSKQFEDIKPRDGYRK